MAAFAFEGDELVRPLELECRAVGRLPFELLLFVLARPFALAFALPRPLELPAALELLRPFDRAVDR